MADRTLSRGTFFFLFLLTNYVTSHAVFSSLPGRRQLSSEGVGSFETFDMTRTIDVYSLENEIDGATLALMDTVEKIATVLPTLKYQLIFLKEREAVMSKIADTSMRSMDAPSSVIAIASTGSAQSTSNDDPAADQSSVEERGNDHFPAKYVIPPLPNSLLKDIEDGSLNKFGPHFSNRQVLIETIAHDLIDNYKLL
jgi:hypothetical protein